MQPSPQLPILTERLALRPFMRGDVDAVFAYRCRDDVAQFLFDGPMTHETCADAVRLRLRQTAFAEEGDRLVLAVERHEGGGVIGEISLIWRSVMSRQGEIGYIFHPDFQHCGFATEAVGALLGLGFRDLDLHRIFARCDVRNAASYRLMERLGMRREGHFRQRVLMRGNWEDEFVYALLREEWLGREG